MSSRHESPLSIYFSTQSPSNFTGEVEFCLAHTFHTTSDDNFRIAGLNLHGTEKNGI